MKYTIDHICSIEAQENFFSDEAMRQVMEKELNALQAGNSVLAEQYCSDWLEMTRMKNASALCDPEKETLIFYFRERAQLAGINGNRKEALHSTYQALFFLFQLEQSNSTLRHRSNLLETLDSLEELLVSLGDMQELERCLMQGVQLGEIFYYCGNQNDAAKKIMGGYYRRNLTKAMKFATDSGDEITRKHCEAELKELQQMPSSCRLSHREQEECSQNPEEIQRKLMLYYMELGKASLACGDQDSDTRLYLERAMGLNKCILESHDTPENRLRSAELYLATGEMHRLYEAPFFFEKEAYGEAIRECDRARFAAGDESIHREAVRLKICAYRSLQNLYHRENNSEMVQDCQRWIDRLSGELPAE